MGLDTRSEPGMTDWVRPGMTDWVKPGMTDWVKPGMTHLPSFILFSWAHKFLPTKPLAPVTRIFILLIID